MKGRSGIAPVSVLLARPSPFRLHRHHRLLLKFEQSCKNRIKMFCNTQPEEYVLTFTEVDVDGIHLERLRLESCLERHLCTLEVICCFCVEVDARVGERQVSGAVVHRQFGRTALLAQSLQVDAFQRHHERRVGSPDEICQEPLTVNSRYSYSCTVYSRWIVHEFRHVIQLQSFL